MPPKWVMSGWMMSADCCSNSSRYSCRAWIRSPVATGIRIRSAAFFSAARFSLPARLEWFGLVGDLDRGGRVEAAMHFDHDLDVRPDSVAHRFYQPDRS